MLSLRSFARVKTATGVTPVVYWFSMLGNVLGTHVDIVTGMCSFQTNTTWDQDLALGSQDFERVHTI